ncbi:DUF436 family protein [Siminovitchia fortis]|uniref:DUF436 family protein n=1 Tax=Siminovitchia fortis TaxID=254758 RepID=UPI0021B3B3A6|nr:DUF436 family protein [Siminovitchia fortis]
MKGDGGIAIGERFMGMHLKDVGVGVRVREKCVGGGDVRIGRRRGKVIGGGRGVYEKEKVKDQCWF